MTFSHRLDPFETVTRDLRTAAHRRVRPAGPSHLHRPVHSRRASSRTRPVRRVRQACRAGPPPPAIAVSAAATSRGRVRSGRASLVRLRRRAPRSVMEEHADVEDPVAEHLIDDAQSSKSSRVRGITPLAREAVWGDGEASMMQKRTFLGAKTQAGAGRSGLRQRLRPLESPWPPDLSCHCR
jgi:hypothetical protein